MIHGSANDFQLTLNGTTKLLVTLIFKEVSLLAQIFIYGINGLLNIVQYFFMLRLPINQHFRLFHILYEERIRQRAASYKVNITLKQIRQTFPQEEEIIGIIFDANIRFEIYQQINVALIGKASCVYRAKRIKAFHFALFTQILYRL